MESETNVIPMDPSAEATDTPVPQETTQEVNPEQIAAEMGGGRVVDGAQMQQEALQQMARDPWVAVAAGCSGVISDILGQIDLHVNYHGDKAEISVPTGRMGRDGKPEVRTVQAHVASATKCQALANAAESLLKVHDYAMRRASKNRNQHQNGGSKNR